MHWTAWKMIATKNKTGNPTRSTNPATRPALDRVQPPNAAESKATATNTAHPPNAYPNQPGDSAKHDVSATTRTIPTVPPNIAVCHRRCCTASPFGEPDVSFTPHGFEDGGSCVPTNPRTPCEAASRIRAGRSRSRRGRRETRLVRCRASGPVPLRRRVRTRRGTLRRFR